MNYEPLKEFLISEFNALVTEEDMDDIIEIVKAMLAEEEAEQGKPAPPPTEIPEHYPKGC